MRQFYALAVACMFTTVASAQITLTYEDYAVMANASTLTSYHVEGSDNVQFDIGGNGNGQVWDMSGFTYVKEASPSTMVDPSETPYPNAFPDANIASYVYTAEGEGYSYMKLDQSGFYLLGVIGTAQGQSFSLEYDPPKPEMKFPGTLGTTWSYDGNPSDLGGVATQQTRGEYEIDAAGTLKLPEGDYECLRLRNTEYQTTKIEYNGQVISEQVTKTVSYTFMTEVGVNASLLADSTSPKTGSIMASNFSYSIFGSSTAITDLALSNDFTLEAAYPNPLVSGVQTTLAWNVPVRTNVVVKVYDAGGREVASVFEGAANAGVHTHTFSTAGIAPGMYFIRLTSGSTVRTTPLAVFK